MKPDEEHFDPRRRAAEKQCAREEDRVALERGEKTIDDLRAENGLFVFPNVRIDFDDVDSLA
jgi:hypothetical protein